MNPRRLYRCRHDRQLAGVAAGMAEYLEIDPTVVRILWILSAFLGGFTILLYIIMAFVIPLEPATAPAPGSWRPAGQVGAQPGQPLWGPAAAPTGEAADAADASSPTEGAWVAGTEPAPGFVAAVPDHRHESRPGGGVGLFFGVLLVVFGSIALINVMVPSLMAHGLIGAGFLVAIGVALLVGSARRSSYGR